MALLWVAGNSQWRISPRHEGCYQNGERWREGQKEGEGEKGEEEEEEGEKKKEGEGEGEREERLILLTISF